MEGAVGGDAGVVVGGHPLVEGGAGLCEVGGVGGVGGEVFEFVGVGGEVVELFGGAVDVLLDEGGDRGVGLGVLDPGRPVARVLGP